MSLFRGKKHRGPDETSLGSRASSDDEDHSRPTSSHLEGQSPVGTGVRPWKSTSDVSSGLVSLCVMYSHINYDEIG